MYVTYSELNDQQKDQALAMFSVDTNLCDWYYEIGLSGDVLSRRREKPEDEKMRDLDAPTLPGLEVEPGSWPGLEGRVMNDNLLTELQITKLALQEIANAAKVDTEGKNASQIVLEIIEQIEAGHDAMLTQVQDAINLADAW